jgi:hypothetical protein
MQIVQFFCVVIGTFSSTIQNKRNFVFCEPTQISGIAAVAEPKQRGNLKKMSEYVKGYYWQVTEEQCRIRAPLMGGRHHLRELWNVQQCSGPKNAQQRQQLDCCQTS